MGILDQVSFVMTMSGRIFMTASSMSVVSIGFPVVVIRGLSGSRRRRRRTRVLCTVVAIVLRCSPAALWMRLVIRIEGSLSLKGNQLQKHSMLSGDVPYPRA